MNMVSGISANNIDALLVEPNAAKQKQPQANINEAADTIALTEESKVLSEQYSAAQVAKQMTGTTADGTAILVQRTEAAANGSAAKGTQSYSVSLQGTDGASFNLNFSENIRISKGQNNSYSAYFANSNTTRTFAADGTFTEVSGDAITADADSIYIGVTGGTITTGNGNNQIFVYGDDTTVTGGSGNDTVHLADNVSGVSIDTGEGNDSVTGKRVYDGNIQMGGGNNSVALSGMHGGSVSFADGDNTLDVGQIDAAKISFGDGSNSISSQLVVNNGSITAGNGNNILTVDAVGKNIMANENTIRSSSNAHISLGNGDNTIAIRETIGNSSMDIGDGNNEITVQTLSGDLSVRNGDNTLNAFSLGNMKSKYNGWSARVTMGDGNNSFDVKQMVMMSELQLGDGNNTINAGNLTDLGVKISAGDGKNNISVDVMSLSSSVILGDGENNIKVNGMNYAAKVKSGNGDTKFSVNDMHGEAVFGNGNNFAYANSIGFGGSMYFGNGNNSFIANSVKDSATLAFGDGGNAASIRAFKDSTISFGAGKNSLFIELMDNSRLNLGNGNTLVLIESAADSGYYKNHVESNGNSQIFDLSEASFEQQREELISQFEKSTGLSFKDIKSSLNKDMSDFFNVAFSEGSYASQYQILHQMKSGTGYHQ